MNKYDKRRKYYIVLDCETATLPEAINYDGEERKNIAIAKPLIYDLGWKVIDAQGRTYARKNYLISEIFSVPAIFDTAYYASKRLASPNNLMKRGMNPMNKYDKRRKYYIVLDCETAGIASCRESE